MKLFPLLFLTIFASCIHPEQERAVISPEQVYRIITPLFRQLDSLHYDVTINDDSLNTLIADTLIKYREVILSSPDSSGFREPYIVHSPDKQFCTISWDTRQGGTNVDYRAMLLFKTSNGVGYRYPADTADYASTQIRYSEVYELHTSTGLIYLARGYGRGSSALPWQQITAWSIRNDSLIAEPIFPEMSETESRYNNESHLPALFLGFDIHYNSGPAEMPLIEFLDENKKIKIPLPNEQGGWSDAFIYFIFDGSRYKVFY